MDKKKNRYKEQLVNAIKKRIKKQHSFKTVVTALVITLMVVVFVDQIRVNAEQSTQEQTQQFTEQSSNDAIENIYIGKEVHALPNFRFEENSVEIVDGFLKCVKDDHILQWQKGRNQWECRKSTKVVFDDLGGSVKVSSTGTIQCKNNGEMLYWNKDDGHWSCGNAGSTIAMSDINDVDISQNPTMGDIMYFDGEDWSNDSIPNIISGSFFAQNGNTFNQNALLGTNDNHALVFETNDIERMRITESGNIGIGTDAPDNLLTVNGNQNTTGHSAFGNAAVVDGNTLPFFGGAPLSTTISVAESITATTPGVYAGITNVLELNPSADVLGNMYMSDFNVMTIASSNVQDFGFVVGNATMNIHEGSGMIDSMIGSLVATGNDSTGSIEDLVSVSGSLVNSNVAGSVTNAYGLDSYISNSGAMTNVYGVDIEARTYDSGIMANVRGINIHTPQTRDTSSMTNIYGLYINDQSGIATNDEFNIYSLGANSVNYFEGNVGIGTDAPDNLLTVNGNQNTTGHSAFGNRGVIDQAIIPGFPPLTASIVMNVAESFTDMSTEGNAGFGSLIELNPSVAPNPSNMSVASFDVIYTASGNTQDFGMVGSAGTLASHTGNGNVGNLFSTMNTAENNSTGTINYAYGNTTSVQNSSTGTMNHAYGYTSGINNRNGGSIVDAWSLDAYIANSDNGSITNARGMEVDIRNYDTGSITNVYGIDILAPRNYSTGSITNAYGLRIGDYSTVPTNDGFNIYSLGANSVNYFAGNVGIGTSTPSQKLHISGNMRLTGALYDSTNSAGTSGYVLQTTGTGTQWVNTSTLGMVFENASGVVRNTGTNASDDFVFGSPQLANDGNSDHNARIFFDKSRGAFRAGVTTSTQWDDSNVGNYSIALGDNSIASGLHSVSIGRGTTASNSYAIAFGHSTTASGSRSTAFGRNTTASGDYSMVFGSATTARAGHEVVFGQYEEVYTPNSTTGWDASDRLFVVANGAISSARSNALTILKNGNVGIGTSSPINSLTIDGTQNITGHSAFGGTATVDGDIVLSISETFTDLTSDKKGLGSYIELNPSADSSGQWFDAMSSGVMTTIGNTQHFGGIEGMEAGAVHMGTGLVDYAHGSENVVVNYSTGTITNAYGVKGLVGNYLTSGGNIINASGALVGVGNQGSGTITNAYGVNIESNTYNSSVTSNVRGINIQSPGVHDASSMTNIYGLYVNDQSGVATNNGFNIYSLGANSVNYFEGDVGIGTTTPTQKLTVYNGSTTGTYTTSGWVHSSDRNLKTNIEPIENSLEKVLSLENVYFNWKANPNSNRQIGFIAQDVKEIIPEIVVGNEKDGYGLSYGNMSALLTGAIQEQNISITSNTLQTDTNINTLQQLQTSVDENLTTIQGQFVNVNDGDINLSLQVDNIENHILVLQSEANIQSDILTEIQDTLEEAQEGIDILTHIDTRILTIDPDVLLFINDEVLQKTVVDEDGNETMQDITELTLSGIMTVTTLKTQHIQTNTFAISDDVIDENDGKDVNASSIGTAIIPAGETEIKVSTQAVAEGSRVFVTPKKALNQALAAEDIVWDESFVVKLLELHDTDISFDWFIVGSK